MGVSHRLSSFIETTSKKAAAVVYKKPWLRYRDDRSVTLDRIWIFTDGSNSGWHAAVVLDPFSKTIRRIAHYQVPKSKNIGPELWALNLGLRHVTSEHPITVVHDYIGTGAWIVGAWEIKSPNVLDAVNELLATIKSKGLDIRFIHTTGHQKDLSDFSKWNNHVDALCTGKKAVDTVEPWGFAHKV